MVKKTLKIFLKTVGLLLILFLVFSFWMSPRLGGLISLGKEQPDTTLYHLAFDTLKTDLALTYTPIIDPDLELLRKEYRLDTLVASCKSDFDKVIKIQSWVQSRWKHDGENTPKYADALYILKQAEKGHRFRCVEYSLVTTKCLQSLGFIVRPLGLMTKDVSDVKSGAGHAANEVYLNDLKKWIFIDPQFDVITTLNGKPLNAVELQKAIAENQNLTLINPNQTTTLQDYKTWIGPYLYYFYVSINNQRVTIKDRLMWNKKQLTLLPIGAEKPTYFQKIMRITTSNYTHSVTDFYPQLSQ